MNNFKKLVETFLCTTILLIPAFTSCALNSNGQADTADKTNIISETTADDVDIDSEETDINIIETTHDDTRIYESMKNYKFISDSRIIGEWEYVDLVLSIDDFDPLKQNLEKDKLIYLSYSFFDDGDVIERYTNSTIIYIWTKGYILYSDTQVILEYEIRTVDDEDYLFIQLKSVDYLVSGKTPEYCVFKKVSDTPRGIVVKSFDDVRNLDLIKSDLTEVDLYSLWFNEKTKFPATAKVPNTSVTPADIIEAGKNPGLGVRALHEQGITGEGVTMAIIDQPLYVDSHPEYKGKIIEYKDFDCQSEISMHGPGVTSLLVGDTIGTAPGAKIYYAAVPSWKGDATYYADALDWIVETNKNLPDSEKIRAVSVSAAPSGNSDFANGDKWIESVKRADEAGILVLDCTTQFGIIGPCRYKLGAEDDVTQCIPGFFSSVWNANPNVILAPIHYRTTAEEYNKGDFSYQYNGSGGLSWGIPYTAGVLAMGWEIRPELTSDEIVDILFKTAYVDKQGNKIIYPTAFIDYINKLK